MLDGRAELAGDRFRLGVEEGGLDRTSAFLTVSLVIESYVRVGFGVFHGGQSSHNHAVGITDLGR